MEGDFRIGDWLVQPQIGTIIRGDDTIHLEPKVMEVLVYLAQHSDAVLPKERIIQAVWGDTFVTDEVLTNAISELRRAFGDDAKDPRFIQTLPRRGYRLIAEVTHCEQVDSQPPSPTSNQLWKQSVLVVMAAVLVLAVALMMWWSWSDGPSSPDEPIESIAVLPFVNVTGDEDSEFLCLGIPGSISSGLSRLSHLKVMPSFVLQRYRGRQVEPRTVAAELDVRAILTGSVIRRLDTLGIRVELVDGEENRLLWGEAYNHDFTDLFATEREIAEKIAEALRLQLNREDRQRLIKTNTTNPKAYGHYLRGQSESLEKSIPLFEKAIEEDPNYALAYVALAYAHKQLGFGLSSEDSFRKAKEYAQKALEVDDRLPDAHQMMGNILIVEGDWSAAGEEFTLARELDPNLIPNMDEVHYLLWMGLRRNAVIAVDRAAAQMDPLSSGQHRSLSWRYYIAGDHDRSLKHYEKGIELGEGGDKWIGMLSYQAKGLEKLAFEAALSVEETSRLPENEVEEYKRSFANSGMRGFWKLWIDKNLENISIKPYDWAATYAFLGEKDQAFKFLSEYHRLSSRIPFVADARFDSLRDDPRFEELLRKLNLPEEAIQRHLTEPETMP